MDTLLCLITYSADLFAPSVDYQKHDLQADRLSGHIQLRNHPTQTTEMILSVSHLTLNPCGAAGGVVSAEPD